MTNGQPDSQGAEMMDSPWEFICAALRERYTIPAAWIELNVLSERLVRERLDEWVRPMVNDPLSTGLPERIQISHYQYFLAFSHTISDAILWDESELYIWREAFLRLPVDSYLRACAAMYCTKLVAAHRDSLTELKILLSGVVAMCRLPWGYAEEWLRILSHAGNEEKFLFEVGARLYCEMADILGFSKAAPLRDAVNASKWPGLAMVVAEQHNEFGQSPEWVKHSHRVLNAQDEVALPPHCPGETAISREPECGGTDEPPNAPATEAIGSKTDNCEENEPDRVLAGLYSRFLDIEMTQAKDLMLNCQNKFQYAKTYRVLCSSANQTASEMRAAAAQGGCRYLEHLGVPAELCSPEMFERFIATVYLRVIEEKLEAIAVYFHSKWNEPITNYTTPPSASGCFGVVLLLVLWVGLLVSVIM